MSKRQSFTSPVGVLGFPCAIAEPDATFADQTKPNDKGEYKARLVLPKESAEAKAFLAKLESVWEQYYNETCTQQGKKKLKVDPENLPWADELDRDTDEPTGNIVFRFKLKARVEKKDGTFFDQRPKVFDAKGTLIREVPAIGPGSRCRIAGQVNCWYTSKVGMSLWLEACQLIQLVERGGGKDAGGYGFGAEKGFTAEQEESMEPASSAAVEGGGDF